MISAMKSATHFIHLAFLDHCPNVVVDAVACRCKIHCSSTGGTSEIAGNDATVLLEDEWNFLPLELYKPPSLDFMRRVSNDQCSTNNDIGTVAKMYEDVLI